MTNNCANSLLKIRIRCWDINKTRQGITFICRTLYMHLQFRGYSVSSWSSDLVAKDQDPEPRFRPSARHDTRQRELRRPCVRLHVPGKFPIIWWSVLSRYTQTYRARFRSNVLLGQHLEG